MRKKRRSPKARRGKRSTRARSKTLRAPRTTKELFARSKEFQDEWNRIVQVPSEMRSKGLSLREASRNLGVSPDTVIRLARAAFKKRRNGRYEARVRDRLLRILVLPSAKGLREIAVRDSKAASLIGQYWAAVEKYVVRGDASALNKLGRETVIDASGKSVRLLTDLEELRRQASAGVLHFESLYGRNA